MTYVEILLFIQGQGDNVLAQGINDIITKHRRYLRVPGEVSSWKEDTEPGAPEEKFGRGGKYYIWKREELPPETK